IYPPVDGRAVGCHNAGERRHLFDSVHPASSLGSKLTSSRAITQIFDQVPLAIPASGIVPPWVYVDATSIKWNCGACQGRLTGVEGSSRRSVSFSMSPAINFSSSRRSTMELNIRLGDGHNGIICIGF